MTNTKAMTDEQREEVETILRRFHNSSCYPDAQSYEIESAREAIEAALSAPMTTDNAKDAERYRFLRGEAYECVIPHGNKIKNKRTAWTIKLHVGENFNEAIDAAISDHHAQSKEKSNEY